MKICQQCRQSFPGMHHCPQHGSPLIEVEGESPSLQGSPLQAGNIPILGTSDGTGTMLLGIKPQPDKTCYATAWNVWNNLPTKPLSRHRVRVLSTSSSGQIFGTTVISSSSAQLQFVETTPLSSSEIFWTVLWHWIIAPLVLLAPFIVTYLLWGSALFSDDSLPKDAPEKRYLGIGLLVGLISIGWGRILWLAWRDDRLKKLVR